MGEAGDLKSMTVHTKTVDWTIAQLVMPMEAVVADPPSPVIAGDFMTHSSYVGCYSSADAAADAVCGRSGAAIGAEEIVFAFAPSHGPGTHNRVNCRLKPPCCE